MRIISTLLLTAYTMAACAQGIEGTVRNEKKTPVSHAVVHVYHGDELVGGYVTDVDGGYIIRPLAAGYYNVEIASTGYDSVFAKRLIVSGEYNTRYDVDLKVGNGKVVQAWKVPLTTHCSSGGGLFFSSSVVATIPILSPVPISLSTTRSIKRGKGQIKGAIHDINSCPVSGATLLAFQAGELRGATISDFDGSYAVDSLEAGFYEVQALHVGYDSAVIKEVVASDDTYTSVYFVMVDTCCPITSSSHKPIVVHCGDKNIPSLSSEVISHGNFGTGNYILTRNDLSRIPTRNFSDMFLNLPNAFQQYRSHDFHIFSSK